MTSFVQSSNMLDLHKESERKKLTDQLAKPIKLANEAAVCQLR